VQTVIFMEKQNAAAEPAKNQAAEATAGQAARLGGKVEAAVVIRKTEPVYPVLARNTHVSGPVVIEGTIDLDSKVRNPHVISGHALLRQAALDSVSQWRFRPAVLNGQPTSTLAQIQVNFTLTRYRQRKLCDDASEERQA